MAGMTKGGRFLVWLALFSAVWSAAFFEVVPVSASVAAILPYLPVWVICCFGCYSLGNIGFHLATFGDADEASAELKTEISQAKKDLESKGVKLE